MGSTNRVHQLSGGLYVSGAPAEQPKERAPTMTSTVMPYTGGDIKKSGELGKMFDINVLEPHKMTKKSGPISGAQGAMSASSVSASASASAPCPGHFHP